jgi:hypothetical protein
MKLIPVGNNYFTKVSDSEYPRLSKFVWRLNKDGDYLVVVRKFYINKKRTNWIMSRFILSAPTGKYVDHINGDTLDNQNENLRLCSQTENQRNRKINSNNKSGYKGVKASGKKWVAIINCNKKHKYLGTFETREDAAKAYNEYAKNLYGEFARLNVLPTKQK